MRGSCIGVDVEVIIVRMNEYIVDCSFRPASARGHLAFAVLVAMRIHGPKPKRVREIVRAERVIRFNRIENETPIVDVLFELRLIGDSESFGQNGTVDESHQWLLLTRLDQLSAEEIRIHFLVVGQLALRQVLVEERLAREIQIPAQNDRMIQGPYGLLLLLDTPATRHSVEMSEKELNLSELAVATFRIVQEMCVCHAQVLFFLTTAIITFCF